MTDNDIYEACEYWSDDVNMATDLSVEQHRCVAT